MTARWSGEHQKACYRLLVFGVLALFGPPAFGLRSGPFTVLYAVLLVAYAAWAVRLTVVFHDDEHLGYFLTLFDITITLPLVVWGSEAWLAAPLVGLWVAGLTASAVVQRRRRLGTLTPAEGGIDQGTGFKSRELLAPAVEVASSRTARTGEGYGLVVLRVQRFGELVALHGREAADRSLGVLGRRVLQQARQAEAFRVADDEIAFLLPDAEPLDVTAVAFAAGAAGARLVDGRRPDTSIGYAVCPRDGYDLLELLRAAAATGRDRRLGPVERTGLLDPRVAVG